MTQTSIIIAYVTTQDFPALRASVFGFEFGLGYSVLGFGLTERAHTGPALLSAVELPDLSIVVVFVIVVFPLSSASPFFVPIPPTLASLYPPLRLIALDGGRRG